jgi:hypothetical protein
MRRLAAGLIFLLIVTACSVPTDQTAEVIAQEELPESLRRVTTTTTAAPLPTATIEVTYYLLFQPEDQSQRKVTPIVREIPDTRLLTSLLAPMFADDFATGGDAAELINQLTRYEFVEVRRPDGSPTATIVLRVDPENLPGDDGLADAAAQLVWTLTTFVGVDSILIEINDDLQGLPTDGGRTDRPVNRDDYRLYDPEFTPEPVEITTTTSTSTTTTEAPPASTTAAPGGG